MRAGKILHIILLLLIPVGSLHAIDTEPPKIEVESDGCGSYTVRVTDDFAGVYHGPTVVSTSYNFKPPVTDETFREGEPNLDFSFTVEVNDITSPGFFKFYVFDTDSLKTGKSTVHEFSYSPNLLSDIPENKIVPETIVGRSRPFTIIVGNSDGITNHVKTIRLKNDKEFTVMDNLAGGITISGLQSLVINMSYKPGDDSGIDRDTLEIIDRCERIRYEIPIESRGILPNIVCEDYDFGIVLADEYYYARDYPTDSSAIIRNTGTGVIDVSKTYFTEGTHFDLFHPDRADILDAKITADNLFHIRDLVVNAKTTGEIIDTLVISSNSPAGDSLVILRAFATKPGAYITSGLFGRHRLNAVETLDIFIRNNSRDTVIIDSVYSTGDVDNLNIELESAEPADFKNQFLYPVLQSSNPGEMREIRISAKFNPTDELLYETKIIMEYSLKGKPGVKKTVFNYLRGEGYRPRIEIKNYIFTNSVAIGDTSETEGIIEISNPSERSETKIFSVKPIVGFNPGIKAFIFENMPEDTLLKPGEKFSFPVRFSPVLVGRNYLELIVKSDAYVLPCDSGFVRDTFFVEGFGYQRALTDDRILFPRISKCEEMHDTLRVINTSPEGIEIDSISFSGENSEVFHFEPDFEDLQYIAAGDTFMTVVFYMPYLDDYYRHSANIDLFYSGELSRLGVAGDCRLDTVVATADTLENLTPDMILYLGSPAGSDLAFYVQSKENIFKYGDTVTVSLKYNPDELSFLDEVSVFDDSGNFLEVLGTDITTKADDYVLNVPVSAGGSSNRNTRSLTIFPKFKTMLSGKDTTRYEVCEVALEGKTCYELTASRGMLTVDYCSIGLYDVVLSHEKLRVIDMLPNPAAGNTVRVDFSVPFDMQANIKFYDFEGKLVLEALNGMIDSGYHSILLDISDLTGGIYAVILQQGEFIDADKLIIFR